MDGRQEFSDSRLRAGSLANLGLDSFYVADADHRCLRGMSLTTPAEEITDRSQFTAFFGAAGDLTISPGKAEKAVTGLVCTDRGPMMIAARSILICIRPP